MCPESLTLGVTPGQKIQAPLARRAQRQAPTHPPFGFGGPIRLQAFFYIRKR
jgi:hypothetical protein